MEMLTTISLYLKQGMNKITHKIWLLALVLLVNAGAILLIARERSQSLTQSGIGRITSQMMVVILIALLIALDIGITIAIGIPERAYKIRKGFEKIGFHNHEDEYPVLLTEKHQGTKIILEFDAAKIPLETWQAKQCDLQAAMNLMIVSMKNTEGLQHVEITAVEAENALPEKILWDTKYLSTADFEILLGIGYLGAVTVNLNRTPHILIGGSTGSGKTEEMRLILAQAVQKNAIVSLYDGKGGYDYDDPFFLKHLDVLQSVDDLAAKLDATIAEMNSRKAILKQSSCKNIKEYNEKHPDFPLQHIVIGVDELAEITDTSGKTKEQKKQAAEIVDRLSTIARLGRAFGIHLLLATQRPDATVVPGQIKNNIDCRICGRADNVLSQMILDSTVATEIPKDAQGRFILNFQ